jgi:hypothetical protein
MSVEQRIEAATKAQHAYDRVLNMNSTASAQMAALALWASIHGPVLLDVAAQYESIKAKEQNQ